ncbi:MAG: hypothetical protein LBJ62_05715 [Bifidobacteriaceae bacterium]|jgi:hypothetical protein|nr:hypothetical protein [Bifidobacteriaceae bacterium]
MAQTLTSALAETHHLLALASDIDSREIALLASTRWRRVEQAMGEISVSRYSSLFGPYTVGAGLGASLGLPRGLHQAWIANTLTERGEPPLPGSLDPTGVSRTFPSGLPVREERRVVDFLVAAARRLGGVVRFHGTGLMVAPVPDGALDLSVYSPLWLEPDAALVTARSVVPRFELAIDWHAFVPEDCAPPASQPDYLDLSLELEPDQRTDLLARAAAHDRATLSGEQSLDRFALTADLGPAGTLVIEISGVEQPPGALREVGWAEQGAVEYRVRWIPLEPSHLLMEFPPAGHCLARAQMANLLAGIARVVHHTVGGEVLDSDGFPIDPADL